MVGALVFATLLGSPLLVTGREEPASPIPDTEAIDRPPPGALAASVSRVVERLEAERSAPCLRAQEEGRPCFPSEVQQRRPDASVRDSLSIPLPPDVPSPGRPPTVDELRQFRPKPRSAGVTLATFDPGCVAKMVSKVLQGKSDVYYVYRLRDVQGERIALYPQSLDAKTFQGELELVGRFRGECEAVRVVRREERKLRARSDPRSLALPPLYER